MAAQYIDHHLSRDLLQGGDGGYAHRPQQVEGLFAHHRDLADGKRRQKRGDLKVGHLQLPVWLGLSCGYLGYRFVNRKPNGNGQTRMRMMACRNSRVHFMQPKKRSIPVISR